jgi:transcriptional regulator with XRE-family HTH domain
MVSGRKPDLGRWRQVARLRARGLTLEAIGRRLGLSRQRVYAILEAARRRETQAVPCRLCGTIIAPEGALARHGRQALCLTCLGRSPATPFGERLRAYRLAAGLTRAELARRAELWGGALQAYEEGQSRPSSASLQRLAQALGVAPAALEPGGPVPASVGK